MSTNPQVPTVQDRSSRYTIAIAMVAGLGGLMFGYDIGVIADAKIGIRKLVVGPRADNTEWHGRPGKHESGSFFENLKTERLIFYSDVF